MVQQQQNDPAFWNDAKVVDTVTQNDPSFWDDAIVLDAPNNTVFDEKNDRMLSLPQGLNATETDFVIKRDVDEVENFMGMEDVGVPTQAIRGINTFIASLPGSFGKLLKESGELAQLGDVSFAQEQFFGDIRQSGIPPIETIAEEQVRRSAGEALAKDADSIIERNRKYMADAGFTQPDPDAPLPEKIAFDLGNGAGSILTAVGLTGLTRQPGTAAVFFGALAKSDAYIEAREAGVVPVIASELSDLRGITEAGLEALGLTFLFKTFKGNTAVKRFTQGFAVEFAQEASQATAEELTLQGFDIRDKAIGDTVSGILYEGFLGGTLGGGTSATVGAFVKNEAKEQGIPEQVADAMGKYAEDKFTLSQEDLTEFVRKEVAPLAADDKKAMEFMQLFQSFGKGSLDVQREQLQPEQQKLFDEYIEVFNQSVTDTFGIRAVERKFFDKLVEAGVDPDQAVAAGKLIGARADAASRALGISPEEWLASKKLEVIREGGTDVAPIDDFQRGDETAGKFTNYTKPTVRWRPWLDLAVNDENFIKSVKGVDSLTVRQTYGKMLKKQPLNEQEVEIAEQIFQEATRLRETSILKGKKVTKKEQTEIDEDLAVLDDVLFQRPPSQREGRGSITFTRDRTLIRLFENADASTLFHEMGHLFLRDVRAVANASRRPAVKKDFEVVKEWLGAKDDNFTIEQEEKFARGFEAFLREGKAPKPELQSIFDRFKEWLTAIYENARDLDVTINADIRRVFDRMLGGDFSRGERQISAEDRAELNRDYEIVAKMEEDSTLRKDTKDLAGDIIEMGSDAFTPISTRLAKINPKLRAAVRRYTFQNGLYSTQDKNIAQPFIEKVSKSMDVEDYRKFDLALKNRDVEVVNRLVKKHDIKEEFQKVRTLLDDIFDEAQSVGLDIHYLQEYFPRQVKNGQVLNYLNAIRGTPEWTEIEAALNKVDPQGHFTDAEKAEYIDNFLRRSPPAKSQLNRSGFTKERTVDRVKPDFNQYYESSMPTLIRYIDALRHGIEAKRLFGADKKDASVGTYVRGLIDEGVINQENEKELKKIMLALVEQQGTRGVATWSKNVGYIYTMGNPISAITQIGDLAFSLSNNGYYRTAKALTKSIVRASKFKKEDIGIKAILQEFSGEERSAKAVRSVFRAVGLEYIDNVGKEVNMNAAYDRLRAAAKKNTPEFKQQMQELFGEQALEVRKDLIDGVSTENVKFLIFSELSDVQPISLAEMPVYYLNSGNGRVFYMLKTYTLKLIDIHRRKWIDEIASGDPKRMARGTGELIKLATALMLMGASSDLLKDLILGRRTDPDDLVMDNILKMFGISRYQIYKTRTEGIMNSFWQWMFIPPVGAPLNDLTTDIAQIGLGERKLKDAQTVKGIPFIGKVYYWWFGGGRTKRRNR